MHSPVTDSLKVYDILKDAQLPEAQARAITRAIQDSDSAVALDVRTVLDERLKEVATKADLIATKADLKIEMSELRTEMAAMKAELMRWMFVFWVGQVAATVGIVFAGLNLWR
jgi:hypothetical protein